MAVLSTLPAQAQNVTLSFGQKYQVVETYCDRNPGDPDCRSYYRGGWGDSEYRRFYNSRRSSLDNIASGFFGFTFGAALGAALANGNHNNSNVAAPGYSGGGSYAGHVARCEARYRSYDEETNTFMGYDGVRRQCNL